MSDQIRLEKLYFLRDLTYVLNANINYTSYPSINREESDTIVKKCEISIIIDQYLGLYQYVSRKFFEPFEKLLDTDHVSQLENKYENILYSSKIEKNSENSRGRIIIKNQDNTWKDLECIVELAFINIFKFTSNDWKEEMKTLGKLDLKNSKIIFNSDMVCFREDIRKNINIEITALENKILKEKQNKLENEVTELKDEVAELKNKIDNMLYWSPSGQGCSDAKEEFNKLKQPKEQSQ